MVDLIVLTGHQSALEHGRAIGHYVSIFRDHLVHNRFQVLSSDALYMAGLNLSAPLQYGDDRSLVGSYGWIFWFHAAIPHVWPLPVRSDAQLATNVGFVNFDYASEFR